jgi:hypothetical protein
MESAPYRPSALLWGTLQKENPPAFVQCPCNPDGHPQSDGQINQIDGYGTVHNFDFLILVISVN